MYAKLFNLPNVSYVQSLVFSLMFGYCKVIRLRFMLSWCHNSPYGKSAAPKVSIAEELKQQVI